MCLPWNICRLRLNSVQEQYALLTAEPALHAKYNLTPNRSMRNILQARNTHWNYKEQSSENNKNTQHKKLTHVAHRLGKAPCHTRALQLSTTNAQLPLSVGSGVRPQCKHSGQAWNTRATRNVTEWKVGSTTWARCGEEKPASNSAIAIAAWLW